jgi:hypothetical protein
MPDSANSRSYVVVRVNGDTLTIVGTVNARNQKHAMDCAYEADPSGDQKLGAFLESSYREQDVTAEQVFVIHKSPLQKRAFTEVSDA